MIPSSLKLINELPQNLASLFSFTQHHPTGPSLNTNLSRYQTLHIAVRYLLQNQPQTSSPKQSKLQAFFIPPCLVPYLLAGLHQKTPFSAYRKADHQENRPAKPAHLRPSRHQQKYPQPITPITPIRTIPRLQRTAFLARKNPKYAETPKNTTPAVREMQKNPKSSYRPGSKSRPFWRPSYHVCSHFSHLIP